MAQQSVFCILNLATQTHSLTGKHHLVFFFKIQVSNFALFINPGRKIRKRTRTLMLARAQHMDWIRLQTQKNCSSTNFKSVIYTYYQRVCSHIHVSCRHACHICVSVVTHVTFVCMHIFKCAYMSLMMFGIPVCVGVCFILICMYTYENRFHLAGPHPMTQVGVGCSI